MEHKYKITYNITAHENGLTKEEVLATDKGACDSFLFMNFIGEPGAGGALSTKIITGAGNEHKEGERIRELTPQQQFVAWTMLTKNVLDGLPDNDGRKDFLNKIWDIITDTMKG